jgi:hypothetical protein
VVLDGKLNIISGSSRCGKTVKTQRLVRGFKTVFVWDIEAQWHKLNGYTKVTDLSELKRFVKAGKQGKFAYVSRGNLKAEFELFCMCVLFYGTHYGECAVVAEELADVTTTAKAGESWGMLCRRGLKRGISIFAISQRWAEADKTAFGNATDFYLFRMASAADVEYIAKKTSVKIDRLQGLKPLDFIHYDALTHTAEGGKVAF